MSESISDRIQLLMKELGYNKNSFSKAIGLSNNVTIGRIVNENRQPSYEILSRIAQTFGSVNIRWLLSGEGEMLQKEKSEKVEGYDNMPTPDIIKHYEKMVDRQDKQIERLLEQVARLESDIRNLQEERDNREKLDNTKQVG
jgi:transcriptional regulator with XRE-family HTH domain